MNDTSPVHNLLENYGRHVRIPWNPSVAGVERVWYAVYPPGEERRLRAYVGEFERATVEAGRTWLRIDVDDAFTKWLRNSGKEDLVLDDPETMLGYVREPFADDLAEDIRKQVAEHADDNTVVALSGLGGLHGFASVSKLVNAVVDDVPGRVLGFFPGRYEFDQYHLLNQGPDWNYQAIHISCEAERR